MGGAGARGAGGGRQIEFDGGLGLDRPLEASTGGDYARRPIQYSVSGVPSRPLSREGIRRQGEGSSPRPDHPGSQSHAIHPLVVKDRARQSAGESRPTWSRGTSRFSRELETRSKDQKRALPVRSSPVCPIRNGSRSDKHLFGPTGPLAISVEMRGMFLDQTQRGRLDRLNGAIETLNATHPAAPARAMVMYDRPQLLRPARVPAGQSRAAWTGGSSTVSRPVVGSDRKPFQKGSGRLELAQAIADPEESADRAGAGEPSLALAFRQGSGRPRPAILEFGATRRPIPSCSITWPANSSPPAGRSSRCTGGSCSRARTSSEATPRSSELERDPENRLLWRFNRQRLDFESMRDSLLAVSGGARSRRSAARSTPITEPPFSARRTLYGFIDRQNLDGLYRTFDFAVPDATSPRRFVTTVPQQALFLMNSPFLHEQARRMTGVVGLHGPAQFVRLLWLTRRSGRGRS